MSISRQNLTVVIVTLKSQHIIDQCIQSIDSDISILIVENSNNEDFKSYVENKYKKYVDKVNLGISKDGIFYLFFLRLSPIFPFFIINLIFGLTKMNQKTKILIKKTIENYQTIYSENCRIYIRPSGTEPVIRILVEARNKKIVDSLSSKITNKLSLEIKKIIN